MFARRIAAFMKGAISWEKPLGLPRFRSVMSVVSRPRSSSEPAAIDLGEDVDGHGRQVLAEKKRCEKPSARGRGSE